MSGYEWRCDVCRELIADGEGYLTVDLAATVEAERAVVAIRREHETRKYLTGADLTAYPDRVEWETLHRGCDPHIDRPDYTIEVERIRTLSDLLDWNTHLHGKSWLDVTTWDRFIQRSLTGLRITTT